MESSLNRRELLRILPTGAAGCAACPAAAALQDTGAPWTAKADITWEQLFRFTYQKDFLPVMKALAGKLGPEKFIAGLRETVCELAAERMKRAPIPRRDFAAFRANMKQMPPMYRAALQYEVLQETEDTLEYKVHGCLWAKTFREEGAGDIGAAYVCAADFAIAAAFNPKLKLEREKTLMEGHDCCHFKYTMAT